MKDKYKYMRRNNKIRINPKTNAPTNVPKCASEHLSLRITPSLKKYFRNQSSSLKLSMSKYVLNIFDYHLDHLSNECPLYKDGYKHNDNHKAGRSKAGGSSWDGFQKVWNFVKGV